MIAAWIDSLTPRAIRKTGRRVVEFLLPALRSPRGNSDALVVWSTLAGAIWFAATGPSWIDAGCAAALLLVLVAICAVDARFGIIPDPLVGALAILGLLRLGLTGDDVVGPVCEAILVGVAGWGLHAAYRRLRGREGFGLGDVKLVAVGMIWTGADWLPAIMLIAVGSALATIIILRRNGETLTAGDAIPFGPHLALGLWLCHVALVTL